MTDEKDDDKPTVLLVGHIAHHKSGIDIQRLAKLLEDDATILLVNPEDKDHDELLEKAMLIAGTFPAEVPTLDEAIYDRDASVLKHKEQSWAEMNKGKVSKKDRRK